MYLFKPNLLACLFGMLLVFSACTNQATLEKNRYFDIKGFIEQEINRLDSIQPKVKKTAYLNGKKEVNTVKNIHWEQELQSLKDLDINKPAWFDRYTVDTLYDSLITVIYKAKSDDLPVRNIQLYFNEQNRLEKLKAKRVDENFIYASEQTYLYETGKKYKITGKQNMLLIGSNHFSIQGNLIIP